MLATLAWPSAALAEIQFDQLSDCASLQRALAAAQSAAQSCRSAQTTLEQAISNSIVPLPGVRVCWLQRSPGGPLSRFACLRTKLPQSRGRLDCIAAGDASDVEDYRDRFREDYATRAADYLAQARTCSIGNGNASRAVRSLFLGPLNNVARFEMGFALQLGSGVTGNGLAMHGYASVDPAIGAPSDTIEFIAVWQE